MSLVYLIFIKKIKKVQEKVATKVLLATVMGQIRNVVRTKRGNVDAEWNREGAKLIGSGGIGGARDRTYLNG